MQSRYVAFLCLTAAMTTVGSTVVASKIIGEGLPPFTATAIRFGIATPVFVILMGITKTRWPRPDRHDVLLLLVQALCGSVLFTVCLIGGTRLTSAADAGVLLGTLPAVATVGAAIVLRERLTAKAMAAIAVATCGVIVIGTFQDRQGTHSLYGNLLVMAAVVCESIFILLNKRLHVALPPLAIATAMAALGLVGALPFAAVEMIHQEPSWHLASLAGVTYYALVPTVAGFWLWYAGAARLTGTEASLFTAIAPASGVLLSAVMLHEAVTSRILIGLSLVIAAVLMQTLPGRRTALNRSGFPGGSNL